MHSLAHPHAISAAQFDPTGHLIATYGHHHIWQYKSRGKPGKVAEVQFQYGKSGTPAIPAEGKRVWVWDLVTGQQLYTLEHDREGTGVLGLAVDDFVQSEIYRYRIDDLGMLQMASTMGFNTLNDFFELTFVGNTVVKEYQVSLFEGQLELTTFDGRRMTLRQVVGGEFPLSAIQKLQRTQGGRFQTPQDRANRPSNFLGEKKR